MPGRHGPQSGGISKELKGSRRKLTKDQLDRKRECDREAQRQIRQKTKNHIAHLEGLVEKLQAANHDDNRVNDLVNQVKTNQREINKLREILRGVAKLVGSAAEPEEDTLAKEDDASETQQDSWPSQTPKEVAAHVDGTDDAQSEHPAPSLLPSGSVTSPAEPDLATPSFLEALREGGMESFGSNSPRSSVVEMSFEQPAQVSPPFFTVDAPSDIDLIPPSEQDLEGLGQNTEQVDITQKINTIATQIIQDRTLDGRLWYLAGSLLTFILTMPQTYQTPMEYEEDIPVRAVLHGWGAVTRRYYLDPGWLWLRHMDEELYSSLGIPERLAIMRVMRMQYQTQVRPHLASVLPIPEFLKARPAQRFMEHDPLVEHFVWPGFREHIVFGPRKYATTKFMENFRNYSRFMWQHNPEDTFLRDKVTGLYSYSLDFTKRQGDLRCWSMKPGFFSDFPELRHDIPSAEPCPNVGRMLLHFPTPLSRGQRRAIEVGSKSDVVVVDDDHDVTPTQTQRQATLEMICSPSHS